MSDIKVVIIGGGACGASCAARLRRLMKYQLLIADYRIIFPML